MLEVCQDRFLLIVGSAKAGTTALYHYFSKHPQVNPCTEKEPCYFATDYPGQNPVLHGRDPLERYLALYPSQDPARTKLEATPHYLYSPGAARLIHTALPNAKIVISLRDPISRLVSAFNFCNMVGVFDQPTSFDAYVEMMFNDRRPAEQRPLHLRSLEQSRYARHVAEYREVFGTDNVLAIWFDDLTHHPRKTAQRICTFAGLDPTYFDNYNFEQVLETRRYRGDVLRRSFQGTRGTLDRVARKFPALLPARQFVRRAIEPVLHRLITAPPAPVQPSQSTADRLREYYRGDAQELERVLGEPVPWLASLFPPPRLSTDTIAVRIPSR